MPSSLVNRMGVTVLFRRGPSSSHSCYHSHQLVSVFVDLPAGQEAITAQFLPAVRVSVGDGPQGLVVEDNQEAVTFYRSSPGCTRQWRNNQIAVGWIER
jgi:hypothetical protein